ncbi:hypothetical protein LX87_05594 [Larkinella arboricola]|uniref:Sel1 repeat-containing protein n=1 Tax=Larkinella arboricola TaxID=643671 RepID=A0A327WHS8_LARAB|nr:SEL1-like repeat protein [Larkinella arboricola]RAJ89905.1 hypothetical protein LX87_05594 [Larkinella arboricola]
MTVKDKAKKSSSKQKQPKKINSNNAKRYVARAKALQKGANYHYLYSLAKMYNLGETVQRDPKKAISYYEKFFKLHLKKRILIDEIQEFIEMSKLYKELGDEWLAKECLYEAGFEIMRRFPDDEKEQLRQQKRYELDKLLKEYK